MAINAWINNFTFIYILPIKKYCFINNYIYLNLFNIFNIFKK